MEYDCRRGRRRNRKCCGMCSLQTHEMEMQGAPRSKNKFLSSVFSILLMTSLLMVIYLMLEQHCIICSAKCNMSNITKHIEDIAKNITVMKEGYWTLEKKIWEFTQSMPNVEDQAQLLKELKYTFLTNRPELLDRNIPIFEKDVYAGKSIDVPDLNFMKLPRKKKMQSSGKIKEYKLTEAT